MVDNKRYELNSFKSIFTTNYDKMLEKVSSKLIYHLHGSFPERIPRDFERGIIDYSVVYGAESREKMKKFTGENSYIYDKFRQIKGSLMILGYSININDNHINEVIRKNANIKKIVYLYYKNDITDFQSLKNQVVRNFTDRGDGKYINLVDSNELIHLWFNYFYLLRPILF